MTMPTEPSLQRQQQPMPVQVIGYASGETISAATTGVRVLLGILAGFHILIGAPLVLWALFGAIDTLRRGIADPGVIIWACIGVIVGVVDLTCGVWLLIRRRWTWRAAHVVLAMMCAAHLIGCGFAAGVIITYKHAQGWDALAVAIGVFLFGVCSVLFWLHALTKLALLRLNVRRAFFLGDFEPHRLHRIGTFAMMSLYALVVVVGGVWFLLR
jgi:hypothetical protein